MVGAILVDLGDFFNPWGLQLFKIEQHVPIPGPSPVLPRELPVLKTVLWDKAEGLAGNSRGKLPASWGQGGGEWDTWALHTSASAGHAGAGPRSQALQERSGSVQPLFQGSASPPPGGPGHPGMTFAGCDVSGRHEVGAGHLPPHLWDLWGRAVCRGGPTRREEGM